LDACVTEYEYEGILKTIFSYELPWLMGMAFLLWMFGWAESKKNLEDWNSFRV